MSEVSFIELHETVYEVRVQGQEVGDIFVTETGPVFQPKHRWGMSLDFHHSLNLTAQQLTEILFKLGELESNRNRSAK